MIETLIDAFTDTQAELYFALKNKMFSKEGLSTGFNCARTPTGLLVERTEEKRRNFNPKSSNFTVTKIIYNGSGKLSRITDRFPVYRDENLLLTYSYNGKTFIDSIGLKNKIPNDHKLAFIDFLRGTPPKFFLSLNIRILNESNQRSYYENQCYYAQSPETTLIDIAKYSNVPVEKLRSLGDVYLVHQVMKRDNINPYEKKRNEKLLNNDKEVLQQFIQLLQNIESGAEFSWPLIKV